MRVLLFSPVRGIAIDSGDVSYTDSLLADPPKGVEYVTQVDAVAEGSLRFRGRRSSLRERPSLTDAGLLAVNNMEKLARRSGLLFREPFSYATIEPGRFDLVHQHLFVLKQIGSNVTVVSSAGYPLEVFYETLDGWSARRARFAREFDRRVARATGMHYPGLASKNGVMTVYSEAFRQWLIKDGVDETRVRVIATGLHELSRPDSPSDAPYVAFAGRDFHLKGGDVAHAAFRLMKRSVPSMRMKIATVGGAGAIPDDPAIDVIADAGRDETLALIAGAEVLLHPTRLDGGAPYVVLEALQFGVPVVTSQFSWLDDRFGEPAVTKVPLDPGTFARAALDVLDAKGKTQVHIAEHARQQWHMRGSTSVVRQQLADAYAAALDQVRS